MPHRIDLRNSIQRAVLGQQPDDVIAAIRRSHGGPDSGPCDVARHDKAVESDNPPDIFPTVIRLLGRSGFRQLWSDFRRSRRDPAVPPRGFGSYLAANRRAVLRLGLDLPMLSDVARLDFALYLARCQAAQPGVASVSIDLIRCHPTLMLRLQPSCRHLSLAWSVHRLLQDNRTQNLRKMIRARERNEEQGGEQDGKHARVPNLLRLSAAPQGAAPQGIAIEELDRAAFTFESALAAGQSFTIAEMAARQHDASFDGGPALQRLIAAGAVAELLLAPPAETETTAQTQTVPPAMGGSNP